jgi:uncharacterized protein YqjF (DUF2071 family)
MLQMRLPLDECDPRASSDAAVERLVSARCEPLFYADWMRVLFIHFEVDAAALRRDVPFELDLWHGRTFVSVVAFAMQGMRPRWGGVLGRWLFRPIATHGFLNVRAYVCHGGETGIYFLAEWLDNPLSVRLGRWPFGLPYRFARLNYHHAHDRGSLSGIVSDAGSGCGFSYCGTLPVSDFRPCDGGSLHEFLLERYTAFTCRGKRRRFFRVWHAPWLQAPAEMEMEDDSLLRGLWPWFAEARLAGASYSPGVTDVWMGRPHRLPPYGRR